VVTCSGGSSSVIYAADGFLANAQDEKEEKRSRAFDVNPVDVPSTLVVVDMENDDQEKWTNHEFSKPSQDSQRFAAT